MFKYSFEVHMTSHPSISAEAKLSHGSQAQYAQIFSIRLTKQRLKSKLKAKETRAWLNASVLRKAIRLR
jgi:hypothetical protein